MHSAIVQKYFFVSGILLHRLENGKQIDVRSFVRAIVHVRLIQATNENSIARIKSEQQKRERVRKETRKNK